MLILFAITVFSAAAVLFLVQPMAAKMALPLFGGGPSIWNTSMVFFQAALLLGYLYAHLVGTRLKPAVQVAVHAVFAGIVALTLPVALPDVDLSELAQTPIRSLLWFLGVTVGLPFLFISSAGPLLQRWFSQTGHPAATDPYFLYAASNAGSMLGLLGYPFLVERLLPLERQGVWWSWALGMYAVLALACGGAMLAAQRGMRPAAPPATSMGVALEPQPAPTPPQPVTWKDRLWWILLAFVPSSLMLGLTQHLTTDVASLPLLWIIPLSLYLLTFIVAFSETCRGLKAAYAGYLLPFLAIAVAAAALGGARTPVIALAAIHIVAFVVAAFMCHKRLADARPHPSRLTEYFLLISVGGVLGGIFNALIAPVTFDRVYEYPIALALACLLRPRSEAHHPANTTARSPRTPAEILLVLRWAAGPFACLAAYALGEWIVRNQGLHLQTDTTNLRIVRSGLPVLVLALFMRSNISFALSFLLLLMLPLIQPVPIKEKSIHVERTFFGVYEIYQDRNGRYNYLSHGTTFHGVQFLPTTDPELLKQGGPLWFRPTSYYSPGSPIGTIFQFFEDDPALDSVAVIGLGTGTLAAYGKAGRSFDFYEIDPAVLRIAQNPEFFTYLRDSDSQPDITHIIGDARLKLAEAPDAKYGLIVVDAFSSDSIPVHLLTVEAIAMMKQKLRPDGIIAFHTSNRFFDLVPIIAGGADRNNMRCMFARGSIDPDDKKFYGLESEWVAVANSVERIAPLMAISPGFWKGLRNDVSPYFWTDDYSSLIDALR